MDPSVANYPATPNATNAFYAYYSVRLKMKPGSMSATLPASWSFNYLSFYGKIHLDPFTESIDIPWTNHISDQLPGGGYAQYLQVNKNGEVTWRVGEEINCQETNQQVTLQFPSGAVSVELFRIAVKGMTGDKIIWTQYGGNVCDQVTYFCQGNIFVNNCTTTPLVVFPTLPACTPNRNITFDQSIFNGRHAIFVWVDNIPPGENIEDFDGVIHIEPSMNAFSSLDFGILTLPIDLIDVEKRKNADGSFDIYFRLKQAYSHNSTVWTFLTILIEGVYNTSQGGQLDVSLTAARGAFTENGVIEVCAPSGTPAVINIPGFPDCDGDLSIGAEQYDGTDCELGARYRLTFSNGSTMALDALHLTLAFIPNDDNNIPAQPVTTLPCPGCWSYQPGPQNIHFWIYDNTTPFSIQNGETIDVFFPNENDCVRYFVFRAEATLAGQNAPCALPATVNLNEFPACNPEVQGRVFLPDPLLTPAPHYYVNLRNSSNHIVSQIFEDCQEEYSFCPDWSDGPFNLQVLTNPAHQNNYCGCGVTTYDMVLIQRHLLAQDQLTWPYAWIAADANYSKDITTSDIVAIRKCILGIENHYGNPNGASWWYISKDFSLPPNPFNSNYETANTSTVPSNGLGNYGNFYAVKIGDVNQSCVCDNNRPGPRAAEMPSAFQLRAEAAPAEAPNTLRIPVYADAGVEAIALQFGLRFDPAALRLINVTPNSALDIDPSCFGLTRKADGELRFAWFSTDGQTPLPGNALLFTLEFEAAEAALPQGQAVWMSDAVLNSLAYPAATGEELPTQLRWSGRHASAADLIVQPNPAADQAQLYIHSRLRGEAQLRLLDNRGVPLQQHDLFLQEGEQVLRLDLAGLKPGVYTLHLQSGGGTVVKKLSKL
jgi:hypothetical protein